MSDSIASKILIELALTNEYTNLSDEYKKRCQKEILVMQESPGLSKDNILEEFYSIYKSLNGKKGDKNVINSVVAYCLQMSSKLPDLSDSLISDIKKMDLKILILDFYLNHKFQMVLIFLYIKLKIK